ncbi:GTP-binding protein of the rab family [Scheffersomyces xylosifermentans]|uniref:GTP-binding protein of the rab family n=1 Tax=Scheffersomyces xylosifermentans TaxID=1304137 RepID=UPI00315D0600
MIEDSEIPPPSYKIVLLGDSSVGKTSLVHRFVTNKFDRNTANTIGAAFITKKYSSTKLPERSLKFEIWDTAGQERYRSLTPMYYRNARVALICFDLHNFEETFKTAKFWIEQIEVNEARDSTDPIEIRLIGNKRDLFLEESSGLDEESRQAYLEQVKQFCSSNNNIKFHQTSAVDGFGITDLFDSIIDDLDDEFFTAYADRKRAELEANKNGDQFGSILSSRLAQTTNASRCC